MRKLTTDEQQWVESAYPLVKILMKEYRLSPNDVIDWHGELAVALCEAVLEYKIETSTIYSFHTYAKARLIDRIHNILERQQYEVTEIPSGLRPSKTVGRRV